MGSCLGSFGPPLWLSRPVLEPEGKDDWMSLSALRAMEVLRTTSSANSASVASSSWGCFLMVTLGMNLLQSFQVSVLRMVRKTRAAGALMVSEAWTT